MSLRAGSSGHWGGGRCSRRAVPGPGLIAKIFSLRRDLHFAPVDVLLGRGPRTGGDDVRVLQIQPQFKVSQHITIGKRVTTRKIRVKSCWIEYRRQVMHAHEVGGDTTLPPNNARLTLNAIFPRFFFHLDGNLHYILHICSLTLISNYVFELAFASRTHTHTEQSIAKFRTNQFCDALFRAEYLMKIARITKRFNCRIRTRVFF